MRKKKILLLLHEALVPPDSAYDSELTTAEWKTEYHVYQTLKKIGHEVKLCPVSDDLSLIRRLNFEFKPDLVFNLLEEFNGEAVLDTNVVSYLELLRLKYTGCNPRGLFLARDKALAKKILMYHRIPVAKFEVVKKGKKIKSTKLRFPLFVKSLNEEASLGIAQSSKVNSLEELQERVSFIHQNVGTDALVEEFIAGREMYVSVMGDKRLKFFTPTELAFTKSKTPENEFATRKVKWDENYRKRNGIETQYVEDLSEEQILNLHKIVKKAYHALNLSSYVRFDIRWGDKGPYIIEANPNPALSPDDDFALAAKKAGISYEQLLEQILRLAV